MKRIIIAAVAIGVGLTSLADALHPTKEELSKMTPAEKKAAILALAHKKYGGQVIKPGTGSGVIKIVNSQADIGLDATKVMVNGFEARFHYNVEVVNGDSSSVATATADLQKNDANVAVYIVSADGLPRVLVSPEEGWVIINAKALVGGKAGKEELESRLAKETIRSLFFIGGLGQAAGVPIMKSVTYAIDLDTISNSAVMGDAAKRFELVLPSFGLTPKVVKNYRVAVQEGWAPKPADADQQAIWDEIRSLPSKPIKIEFDPAKGK